MSGLAKQSVRIGGSLLCFLFAAFLFTIGDASRPRLFVISAALGVALMGVLVLIQRRASAWILWCLFIASLAGFFSGDVYDVATGQRHWLRLFPLFGFLLMGILTGLRDDQAA